ncbi:UNVERIFIED_CONTAM: putative ribonuclease H protein [Sesamum calycinum]|uniref:Ribonuclease H protein n=1 Tax=Sesamum calycinum TaxID=2727403 RepID=A0AAW2JD42_9LAMI
MELLCDFLWVYQRVSGQLINGLKSSFIVGRQASSLQTQAVQYVLGYQLKHLPVTYLGVPLYKGNRKACLFDSIISRLLDMLQDWAMTNLSHAGRLALIRSVSQATPLHLLQVIHLPKSVLTTIERIFNGFFWGSYNGLWHRLCRIRDMAEPFLFWTLGEGSVSFWHDNWLGKKPLAQLLHRDTYTMDLYGAFLNDIGMGGYSTSFTSVAATCRRLAPFLAANNFSFLMAAVPRQNSSGRADATKGGVWQHFAALFGLNLCDTGSLTHMVHFWRYSTPFHLDLHIRTLIPFLILWFTWTQWNAAKYFGVPFSTDGIILEFKLNTDGSSLGNPGLAGAAGIIRNSVEHVHLAYQFALGTGTSVLAGLTAVWQGLELALTHGLAPLVVEVDATTVISLLQSRASGKWEVQHLIMRIVRLQQLLVVDVQHVFREANGAADHLAKEVASLQLTRVLHHDDITGVLYGILCLDRRGVPHLRGDDGFTTWTRSFLEYALWLAIGIMSTT